jgi:hypothetical protein
MTTDGVRVLRNLLAQYSTGTASLSAPAPAVCVEACVTHVEVVPRTGAEQSGRWVTNRTFELFF